MNALMIATVVAVMAALWLPMHNRLTSMENTFGAHLIKNDHPVAQTEKLKTLDKDLSEHKHGHGHPIIVDRLGKVVERLNRMEESARYQQRLIDQLWVERYGREVQPLDSKDQ
jgi:hypothetical protein